MAVIAEALIVALQFARTGMFHQATTTTSPRLLSPPYNISSSMTTTETSEPDEDGITVTGSNQITTKKHSGTVLVLTDSLKCLDLLTQPSIKDMVPFLDDVPRELVELVLMLARRLRDGEGIRTVLQWIPGHEHDVYPHQLADQLAKDVWQGGNEALTRYAFNRSGYGRRKWIADGAVWLVSLDRKPGRPLPSLFLSLEKGSSSIAGASGTMKNEKAEYEREDEGEISE